MPISSTVASVLLALLAAPPPDDAWVDVLRDHQATNRAALRQGRAHVFVTYKVGDKAPVEVEAHVAWVGDEYRLRYRCLDPDRAVFPWTTELGRTLEQEPWDHRLKAGGEMLETDLRNNRLHVIDPRSNVDKFDESSKLLNLYPNIVWMTCCPPDGRAEDSWSKAIGPFPGEAGKTSRVEFRRVGPDLVEQVRRYDGGAEGVITFSLAHCGNIVKFQTTNPDPKASPYALRTGAYTWRKQGDTCVVETLELTKKTWPGGADWFKDMDYRMRVASIELGPVPRRELTRAALMATLPKTLIIKDHINNKTIRPPVSLDEPAMRKLSERLKERGFAKP
jgi:hypothetical protein